MFDSDLIFIEADKDVPATTTGTTFDVGVSAREMTYAVVVQQVPTGTSPKLNCRIEESDDNSAWRTLCSFQEVTAVGEYFVTGHSNARYQRAIAISTGTSADFGIVIVAPVTGGRNINF